jgi:hypothetical protein
MSFALKPGRAIQALVDLCCFLCFDRAANGMQPCHCLPRDASHGVWLLEGHESLPARPFSSPRAGQPIHRHHIIIRGSRSRLCRRRTCVSTDRSPTLEFTLGAFD